MTSQNKVTTLAAWVAVVVIAAFVFFLAEAAKTVPSELSYALATALGVAGGVTIPHVTGFSSSSAAETIAAHSSSLMELLTVLTQGGPPHPSGGGAAPSAPPVTAGTSGPQQDTPTPS